MSLFIYLLLFTVMVNKRLLLFSSKMIILPYGPNCFRFSLVRYVLKTDAELVLSYFIGFLTIIYMHVL